MSQQPGARPSRRPARSKKSTPAPKSAPGTEQPFDPFNEEVIDRVVAEWGEVVAGQDAAAREIAAIVSRIATLLQRDTEQVLARFSLLDTEFRLLGGLRRAGPPFSRMPSELSPRYVPVTSGGLTGVINRLAGRGLVRRRIHPVDRRGIFVELTASGRQLIETVMTAVARREALIVADLNEPQRREVTRLLRHLLRTANLRLSAAALD